MINVKEITVIDILTERCFDLARSIEIHLVANLTPAALRPCLPLA